MDRQTQDQRRVGGRSHLPMWAAAREGRACIRSSKVAPTDPRSIVPSLVARNRASPRLARPCSSTRRTMLWIDHDELLAPSRSFVSFQQPRRRAAGLSRHASHSLPSLPRLALGSGSAEGSARRTGSNDEGEEVDDAHQARHTPRGAYLVRSTASRPLVVIKTHAFVLLTLRVDSLRRAPTARTTTART